MNIDEGTRGRALELVRLLRNPSLPGEETNEPLDELERILRCPHVLNLMFYEIPELSDENVIARALNYRPFEV